MLLPKILLATSFLFFIMLFSPSNVYAGDGSVTGWMIRMDNSDPSCAGSGLDVLGGAGAGQKTLRFSPTATTTGHCQVQASGKGKVCGGSTTFGGVVAAGTTITYTFTTCSDGGNTTSWFIIGDYDILSCTPQGTQTQTIACPAGQIGSITQQRTSTCPGPTWGPWTTTSNNCTNPLPNLTISTNPTTAYAPGDTTISWSSTNIPAGSTCTNNWNGGQVTPNTSGSYNQIGLNAGNYTFSISCSNGTNASANFTVNNMPPPTISLISNTCTGTNPLIKLQLTAPSSATIPMYVNLYIYNTSNLAYQAYLNPGQSAIITNSDFNPTYQTLASNADILFYATTWNPGVNPSAPTAFSVSTKECDGPQPFTLSLDSSTPSCPTEGNPKLNIQFTKSVNAEYYHIITMEKDSSGNYTIPVPSATQTGISSASLFPGAATTGTRSFEVSPNKQYGVYMVAYKSNGSYIYSNWSTMNSSTPSYAGETPWILTTIGYCDNTPPLVVQMNLLRDCYQPDSWLAAQPMTLLVKDEPAPGAPASSTSGIKEVNFSLDLQSSPTNYQYPATIQTDGTNVFYIKNFTTAELTNGLNNSYTIGARACDNNNQCSTINKKTFLYTNVCTGWIQTRGGNVHSESNIDVPGGP